MTTKKVHHSMVAALFLASFAILAAANLGAQEQPAPTQETASTPAPQASPAVKAPKDYVLFPNALGFQYGELSGYGLSYQFWDKNSGLQISLGGVYMPQTEYLYTSPILDYSVGAEYQYSLYGDDFADWFSGQIYLFGALNHKGTMASEEKTPAVYSADGTTLISPATYGPGAYMPYLNFGLGIGIEMILFEHFSIPLEIGYGAFWNMATNDFQVRLVPQAGFRYRF